jgi:hypothetical protein
MGVVSLCGGEPTRQESVHTGVDVIEVIPTQPLHCSLRSSRSGLDSNATEANAHMNTTIKRTLATVLGGVPPLLVPVSAAMADNAPMGDGMMGNGSAYGHMYGFGSAWLIALVVVVLGVVLVAVLRKTR